MSVPTVPERSLQQNGARSSNRSHRSLPLKGGNVGNADPATDLSCEHWVAMPMPFSAGVGGGGGTPAFSEKINRMLVIAKTNESATHLVPMPRFLRGPGTAGGTFTFALCAIWFGWIL